MIITSKPRIDVVPSFPIGRINDIDKRVKNLEQNSSGSTNSFETVSANLSAYDYTINYNVAGDVESIVYSNGVTKTLNYTSGDVTSIVLSGSTPSGIELTKTLTYTGGDVTGITYS